MKEDTKDFHIYMPKRLADILERIAKKESRTVNGQIRFYLIRALEKEAEPSGV